MITNNLIVIPSSDPWEWSADYVRQTAMRLGNKNLVMVFLWSEVPSIKEILLGRSGKKILRTISNNVFVYQSVNWLPFKRYAQIVRLNFYLNAVFFRVWVWYRSLKRDIDQQILWLFDPLFMAVRKVLGGKDYLLYDCVDYYIGHRGIVSESQIKNLENKLIKNANLVVANSKVLQRHLMLRREDVPLVPQGFDFKVYENPRKTKVKFATKPTVGYVGGINYRLDYELLFELIGKRQEWQFVFWGPEQISDQKTMRQVGRLMQYANVEMGVSDRVELAGIIEQFDVGIIPYDMTLAFNKYCFPMKIFEYFYMGKPVVSAEIEELKNYNKWVFMGKTAEEWDRQMAELIESGWSDKNSKTQRSLALEHSWESKIKSIDNLLTRIKLLD